MNTPTSHSGAGEAKPEAGAFPLEEYIEINEFYENQIREVNGYDGSSEEDEFPDICSFHNYSKVFGDVQYIIERSYEKPLNWYFLCFKPYDINYEKNINWYRTKGFDFARKKIGPVDSFIMTREIMAKKVHLNMMCVSDKPLDKLFHDKNTNYYRIYCVPCYNRHRCLDYILKESRLRYFHKRIDYQYFSRVYPGQMQYF